MTKAEKYRLVEEIGQLEKELAFKKAQLEANQIGPARSGQSKKMKPTESRRAFDLLIKEIGRHSSGGNSVEDQRRERERCG